jgi:hypothetical protein
MTDPDSLVEYVRSLDRRYENLVTAIHNHRTNKQTKAIHGSIDAFDHTLWAAIPTE